MAGSNKGSSLYVNRKRRQAFYGIMYILPGMLFFAVFCLLPIAMTAWFSLTDYNLARSPSWNSFENYVKVFSNTQLRRALVNTGIYVLITVPLQTLLALSAAAFLADKLRNKYGGFLRAVTFIPILVSYVAASAVWRIIYNSRAGILNQLLGDIGLGPFNWLGSSSTALICVSLVAVWKSAGYFMVIFYAGLMNISNEVNEAAIIDGANSSQRFWLITVPILRPITYMIVTLGIIWSFQAFDLIYQLTGGGPGFSTTTIAYIVYAYAFQDKRIGYACAIAVLLLIVILIIHAVEERMFKEGDS